ncbi:MAG: UDP-N-acetylmuramyl-tripeptide synthetase [Nannocystaceae bacterium]|nr:UDP-N-acetylmuramyl-tripeptide synthetase [Nannocystaceae bacterium]
MDTPRPTPPPYRWATDFLTIGVTGTNGKTSTTAMVAATMRAAQHGVVRIGTLGYHLDDASGDPGWEKIERKPSAKGFYDVLEHAHGRGVRHAALEVTSHALARNYAKRWRFDHAVFTNLSPDHLDEHQTWEHYLASKAQLFVHLGPGQTAVLNAADQHALFIDQAMPPDIHRMWFASPTRGPALRETDLAARDVEVTPAGTRVTLAPSPLAEQLGSELLVTMVGDVFAENALAAAVVCSAAGFSPHAIAQGLRCPAVPGRFEVISREPTVVVDFAHTPDALARTCATAKRLAKRRLIVVMGAGGNRSVEKRGPMGRETAARADLMFVTTDNPRDEDPAVIAAAVVAGAEGAAHAEIRSIPDRREAIQAAVAAAREGDVVVVAGKGHETGQEIGGETLPFSDVDEVRRITSAGAAPKQP